MNKILQLPLETWHYTERPLGDELPMDTIHKLHRFILNILAEHGMHKYIPWEDIQYRWLVTKGEYAGTMPKRLRNYMKRENDIKLTAEQVSELGNIAKRGVDKHKYYAYKFVTEKWDRGLFGSKEGDSCYWTCYKHHYPLIMDNGGRALHLYKANKKSGDIDEKPVARCFIITMQDDPELAAFINAYSITNDGSMLVKIARMVSADVGYSYQETQLINWYSVTQDQKYSQRLLYINGKKGYIVADADVINGYFSGDRSLLPVLDPKLGAEPPPKDMHTCIACGDEYEEGSYSMRMHEGDWWCDDCFNEQFFYCDRCSENYDTDYTTTYVVRTGRYSDFWCEHCVENHTFHCAQCDQHFSNGQFTPIEIDGITYCRDCVHEYELARYCTTCNTWYADTTCDEETGVDYCTDCYNEMIQHREEQETLDEQEEETQEEETEHSTNDTEENDCNCAACRRRRAEDTSTS